MQAQLKTVNRDCGSVEINGPVTVCHAHAFGRHMQLAPLQRCQTPAEEPDPLIRRILFNLWYWNRLDDIIKGTSIKESLLRMVCRGNPRTYVLS
jgi:hypothetical protein